MKNNNTRKLIEIIHENPDFQVIPIVDGDIPDDALDVLEKHLFNFEFERLMEAEEECRKIYKSLPYDER